MREKHRRLYSKYTASFSPDAIHAWEGSIRAWVQDNTNPDPYREPHCRAFFFKVASARIDNVCRSGTTLADVRLELANDEEQAARAGVLSAHEVSASSFVDAGLEIEDQQCVLIQSVLYFYRSFLGVYFGRRSVA